MTQILKLKLIRNGTVIGPKKNAFDWLTLPHSKITKNFC